MLYGGLLIGCLRYQAPTSQGYRRICQEMQSKWTRLTWLEIKRSISIIGYGGKAIVHFKETIVGNGNLMLDQNIAIPSGDMLAETEVMVQTGVPMSIDEELSGNTVWVYSSFDAGKDPIWRWNADEGSAWDAVMQSRL